MYSVFTGIKCWQLMFLQTTDMLTSVHFVQSHIHVHDTTGYLSRRPLDNFQPFLATKTGLLGQTLGASNR